ncbi:MAG: alpha/beta fold hydrolase [Magnetococcales bacterium]|nr:alpha/beta fold hydrolase [Magnetococcales bacterium]
MDDGVLLHGWLINIETDRQRPLLIYFGGNAEEVSGFLLEARILKKWAVAAINYRGYGLSGGKPGESVLFADALTLYDRLSKEPAIDPSRIVVMGRSLGSGVAVHLAAKRTLKGVVLISPYDAIREVAQEIYPYAPVAFLLKHPFDSYIRAPHITTPLLALTASDDDIIPEKHSLRLIAAWGGDHRHRTLRRVDHNTIVHHPDYWREIMKFLDQTIN